MTGALEVPSDEHRMAVSVDTSKVKAPLDALRLSAFFSLNFSPPTVAFADEQNSVGRQKEYDRPGASRSGRP